MIKLAPQTKDTVYGVMAEFQTSEELVHAVKSAQSRGFKKIEAFSPFPIEEITELMHYHDKRIPFFVLVAGILGCLGGFMFQYYVSVIAYPIVAGGKPLNSWPAFIPVTFETTILAAAATAVISVIALNGLPMPYHPVFSAKNFERCTQDRFFLCITSDDPHFDRAKIKQLLSELKPETIEEVLP